VGPTGQRCRVVVATHPANAHKLFGIPEVFAASLGLASAYYDFRRRCVPSPRTSVLLREEPSCLLSSILLISCSGHFPFPCFCFLFSAHYPALCASHPSHRLVTLHNLVAQLVGSGAGADAPAQEDDPVRCSHGQRVTNANPARSVSTAPVP
jgi:hypothetical protein